MSNTDTFAFVEGTRGPDRFVYSRICAVVCSARGCKCAVRAATELPGAAGGKRALLAYFLYLRRRRALVSELSGKITVVLFFLDKDIDDVRRSRKRSPHVIYTEYYDIENYVFRFGRLLDAAASAAALDVQSVPPAVSVRELWCRRAASEWKEWVKLCILTARMGLSGAANYGRRSPINDGLYGGVDQSKLRAHLDVIRSQSGLAKTEFARVWVEVSRWVELQYKRRHEDRIFKGKWYSWFLAEEMKQAAENRPCNLNGLEVRLPEVVASTLEFNAPWTTYFVSRMEAVLDRIRDASG